MDKVAEYKKCRCGYNIIVYVIEKMHDAEPLYHFFDGHSGHYTQCYVCPGCYERLKYMMLED